MRTILNGSRASDSLRIGCLVIAVAVIVVVPVQLVSRHGAHPVIVRVIVPVQESDQKLDLLWSGDCILINSEQATSSPVPDGARQITEIVTVRVPPIQPECVVQADVVHHGTAKTRKTTTTITVHQ